MHVFEVDDHWGAYRSECTWTRISIAQDGDEFLAMTLDSPDTKTTGDQWMFDRFVETMEFPTGMTPETWPRCTSTRHGFSIRYSPDWPATDSPEDRLPDVLDDSVRLDAFGSRLSIRRRPLPPGKTIWEFAQAWHPQVALMVGE